MSLYVFSSPDSPPLCSRLMVGVDSEEWIGPLIEPVPFMPKTFHTGSILLMRSSGTSILLFLSQVLEQSVQSSLS